VALRQGNYRDVILEESFNADCRTREVSQYSKEYHENTLTGRSKSLILVHWCMKATHQYFHD
jgi:hypothetical protein